MIHVYILCKEDHPYKIDTIKVNIRNAAEKERIERLVKKYNLEGSLIEYVGLREHIAELLEVDVKKINMERKLTLEEKIQFFNKEYGVEFGEHFINSVIKGEGFDFDAFANQEEWEQYLEDMKIFGAGKVK